MSRPLSVLLLATALSAGVPVEPAAQPSFQQELANLNSPNEGTREKAAKTLGELGRLEAIPMLADAMRDPEVDVRKAVVRSLRSFKRPQAIDGLLIGLTDEEKDIRSQAVEGLLEIYVDPGKQRLINRFLSIFSSEEPRPEVEPIGPVEDRVVDGLVTRLHDEEPSIRRKAAFALGLLRAEDALDPLAISLTDSSKEVRREAVEALARLGGERAGQALTGALSDSDEGVQGEVILALGRIGYRPAARRLLDIWESEQSDNLGDKALIALSKMGAPEARGVFFQLMTNPNPKRRRWAVEGLGRYADEKLTPGLTKDFLREPHPEVQAAYCFALAQVGRPEFVDRIVLNLSKPELRPQSIDYLVELGSPFMSELVTYLSDPIAAIRRDMAFVLMEIGDPDAIPYLRPLLSDSNSEVVDRANQAIAKLERAQVTRTMNPSR